MLSQAKGTLLCSVSGLLVLYVSYIFYPWFDESDHVDNLPVSSIWCSGSETSNRFCLFKNLCYSPVYKEFVFYYNQNSVVYGIPADRFNPALAELSSVANHNTQYFHYVDLPSAVANSTDIIFIETPTLLFSRFYAENIMHVFHDDLLPLYSTLSKICKNKYHKSSCQIQVLFTDRNPWGPYEDLYKTLFKVVSLIGDMSDEKQYCFREAYVGVNKETTWYQYGFKSPQGPLPTITPRTSKSIQHFTDYFSSVLLHDKPKNDREEYAVILIRKRNRRILNINSISTIVSNVTKLKVKLLSLENYSIPDIVRYIQHATVLIGMHGSILILSMFLKPKSILIELYPYAINPFHYTPYKTLVQLPGMNIIYESWRNVIFENTFSHPENPPGTGGILHLSKQDQDKIMSSDEVPFHLCCDNPEWLFRIYQDTIVDTTSFQLLLEKAVDKKKTSVFGGTSNEVELFPSKVQNPVCQINTKSKTLEVSWQQPWNIQFLSVTNIEYELWIQNNPGNDDDVKAYIVTKMFHTFTDVETQTEYLIWVRCLLDKKQGPFSDAFRCNKI